MKQITIEIPEGKEAKWLNGVLTLVDEKPKVTERIKTFDDSCKELGDENKFVSDYKNFLRVRTMEDSISIEYGKDLLSYLKLRIIVAALNEGWEPKFEKGEYRYFPWLYLCTKEQYDELDDEKKRRCVLRSGYNMYSYFGFVFCNADYGASHSNASFGSRLAFRTRELAEYAGKQFTEEWADFMFK